ncbi:hypothetical protein PoB_007257700 [Plakobranchus ocellatus]|uniref:Uncharacterized protein n=1 Tax=Plakobranchus ocellatus TaxID=259542 RepID=A0AAV4DPM8_9GAST|nr:hypothetical protein PoB_007257700 [Plakobranchus ocellatus]
MQCFTYENKYPRTVLWNTYSVPPPEAYKRRPPILLEPTKIGRPYCPDVCPYPKNILDVGKMRRLWAGGKRPSQTRATTLFSPPHELITEITNWANPLRYTPTGHTAWESPASTHPYTVGTYYPELPKLKDNAGCDKITVPIDIPAPFPGPVLNVPHKSSTGDDTRKTTIRMNLVP